MVRGLAACLLLLSVLLGAGRLFTGVVYEVDSPITYLVLKTTPSARMERSEAEGRPIAKEIVLDAEEPQLSYGWLYFGLMRAAPFLIAFMVAASALLLATRPRRERGF